MALRDDLELYAPRLCRYARALAAGHPVCCETAVDMARTILSQTALAARCPAPTGAPLKLALYSLLTEWHREKLADKLCAKVPAERQTSRLAGAGAAQFPAAPSSCGRCACGLQALAIEEREALLLVVVEGFGYTDAARILKISRAALVARLVRARAALGGESRPIPAGRAAKPRPAYLRLVK